VKSQPNVGIIAERFYGPGGIQTCFIELIIGLNRIGIVPKIVWDEEQNWDALNNPELRAEFGGGRLPISSESLRSLPPRLYSRVAPLSIRYADFRLEKYDFIYSFMPGVKMISSVPNLCYAIGPPYITMPDESINWQNVLSSAEIKKIIHAVTNVTVRPDANSRYVTLSNWIAQRFLEEYGKTLPVIWPPVRSRDLVDKHPLSRNGFLFLSRLHEYKNPMAMLALAEAYPESRVTIAGSSRADQTIANRLKSEIVIRNLRNIKVIENPSESEVRQLLSAHEYFVFPAPWEHFGIVTVEAILAGAIPLVHNSGGQKEIVPVRKLRFDNDEELIRIAGDAMNMKNEEKSEVMEHLRNHVARGDPRNYCEEMLKYLRLALGNEIPIE
jgi:glycosyltransferase involved in cell wall biosynthesis